MSGPIARRIRTWAAALVAVTATAAMQANADTFYVNGTCGDDAWTGASSVCSAPDGPKRTIQAGIDGSVSGDTVIVADGTYMGVGNKNLDYSGRLIILRSENGPVACIIDCENDGRGFWFHSGETANAVLAGFTVQNGNIVGAAGGAILCESASPSILNCVLAGNTAGNGGGMYNNISSPTLVDCTFSGNSAGGAGGGMSNIHSSPTVTDCTFTSNTASFFGGGMSNRLTSTATRASWMTLLRPTPACPVVRAGPPS